MVGNMSLAMLIVHIVACVALVLVVLLQAGKGASMGAAFGGSSQTVFGSGGATPFLAKMTTVLAVLFMVTSLGLAILSGQTTMPSVMQDVTAQPAAAPTAEPAPQGAPAPAETPTQEAR
jgi:preprotein translocase subunit SecG